MLYRNLGNNLKVSAIGVGCMPMIKGGNIVYGSDADPDEAIKTIHRAIDLGINFLIPHRFTALFRMKNWSAKRSRASATGW